jgi:L-fuculose-phosphate aldolase
MAPFMTSYALSHDSIKPKDYFGNQIVKDLIIYDPKDFDTWYKRASHEIFNYFKEQDNDMMLIRGYGLYCYSRDLRTLIKKIAILENSCKILYRAIDEKRARNFPLS